MSAFGCHYPILDCSRFSIRKKRKEDNRKGIFEEQPSVVLIGTAGNLWPDFGCIFHITTSLSFITSFKRSRETIEWRSVTLLGTDGSEPWAITKPFFAQQIFNDSLYIKLRKVCWHLHLLDGPGHEQIGSASRRLWIIHFTPSQYFLSAGWGGKKQFLHKPKSVCHVFYAIWRDEGTIHLQWYFSPNILAKVLN